MNTKEKNFKVLLLMVIIYYLLAFGGFSLLSHFGIFYNGPKIHIYAIPMMLVISIYVFFINGKRIFKKEDFVSTKENLLLYLIPYIVVGAVILSIIETIIMKRSLSDVFCMAVLTFLIGISEEGMFRLFIMKNCDGSPRRKIFLFLFSTFTFAALHMMNIGGGLSIHDAFFQSVNAIFFGLVAGLLFLRTQNISSLIFWHMFFDYDIFTEKQGIYMTTTILSFAVDFIIIFSLLCAIIQMVSECRQNKKRNKSE